MLPAMSLTSFGGPDVMPETKLKLLHDQFPCHPLELCELNPSQVFPLTVPEEFLVGLAHNDDATFWGCKRLSVKVHTRQRRAALAVDGA